MAFNLGQFLGEFTKGAGEYARRGKEIEKQKSDELMQMLMQGGRFAEMGLPGLIEQLGLDPVTAQNLIGYGDRKSVVRERV